MERLVQFAVWWFMLAAWLLTVVYALYLWSHGQKSEALLAAFFVLYMRLMVKELNQ